MDASQQPLGIVLVVGGCGFLGHHIVRALVNNPACSAVAVISRNPTQNLIPQAAYYVCDITDDSALLSILATIQPKIIITTAAPLFSSIATHDSITVVGTQNLLDCAKSTASVRHLIYCSSTTVVAGRPFSLIREDEAKLLPSTLRHDPYATAKARADTLVLASNTPTPNDGSHPLRTAVIRPCGIVGEGDVQILPPMLNLYWKGQSRFQLGNNISNFDFVYVTNVADAHVQLALAMVREAEDPALDGPVIAGEAFFITNDQPMLFWDFMRLVWRAAGDNTRIENVWTVPLWFAYAMAFVAEWFVWLISRGTKAPENLSRAAIDHCSLETTFSIDKAKERLGYVPRVRLEEGVRRGVESILATKAAVGKSEIKSC